MQKLRANCITELIRLQFDRSFRRTTVGLRGLFPYSECSNDP